MLSVSSPGVRAPASPAQIDPEASLAELKAIKNEWLHLAEDAGYAQACWDVLDWLGVPTRTGTHVNNVFEAAPGRLWLIGSEKVEKFIESAGGWRARRHVGVFYRKNPLSGRPSVDQVVTISMQVAYFEWEYVTGSVPEPPQLIPEKSIFVPGNWLTVVLGKLPDARQAAQANGQAGIERERQELMAKLLIGADL